MHTVWQFKKDILSELCHTEDNLQKPRTQSRKYLPPQNSCTLAVSDGNWLWFEQLAQEGGKGRTWVHCSILMANVVWTASRIFQADYLNLLDPNRGRHFVGKEKVHSAVQHKKNRYTIFIYIANKISTIVTYILLMFVTRDYQKVILLIGGNILFILLHNVTIILCTYPDHLLSICYFPGHENRNAYILAMVSKIWFFIHGLFLLWFCHRTV